MALLTGNGDRHLDNLALLGGARDARLAPVYDPVPMRAWARHDLRFAIPIDFDPVHGGVAGNLIAPAPDFGMKAARAREILAGLLQTDPRLPGAGHGPGWRAAGTAPAPGRGGGTGAAGARTGTRRRMSKKARKR